MHIMVLLRHGQSAWNQENRFTGWQDVDLTERGAQEARIAAERLAAGGFSFDLAFTSVLKRAVRTLWIVQDAMDLMWIPVIRSWKLNERHYGALQGLNKAETARKFGEEQVLVWRRSYDTPPPALEESDPRFPAHDRKYGDIDKTLLPRTECLKDTVVRVIPYWQEGVVPEIRAGKRVLIAAHGNSLRALVKHLDRISDADILKLNIPTGIPLIYELDDDMRPVKHYYLASDAELEAAQKEVAAQGKAG